MRFRLEFSFPAAAFDDNESTAWIVGRVNEQDASALYGQCLHYEAPEAMKAFCREANLDVDLGQDTDISKFRILPREKWESASLEYFNGEKWIVAATTAPLNSEWKGELESVTARRWRLSLHVPTINSGVCEFQLFDRQ